MAKRRRRTEPKKLVLVVEDEPTILSLAASIVAEAAGYPTLSAANAREGLALFEEGAAIDLLFTDINMPDGAHALNGIELARRAAELRPGLRIIYTSGAAQTDGMTALFVDGSTFLPKPYTREQLIAALRSRGFPRDSITGEGESPDGG